jgi:acetyl-CoA C-acetyltransferase
MPEAFICDAIRTPIARLLPRTGVPAERIEVLELSEVFAAQAVATLRSLGIVDDDPR